MAAETIKQLKSILKQPAGPEAQRAGARRIAIQHATILQNRKDIENEILESVILLSEYPTERGTSYSASNPSPSDVADFKAHIRLFQPSDYDDLIEERNVNGLCGYTLCAQPKPQATKGGQWRLVNVGKSNFDIVNRKDSERWCSSACAKRALYVKVQLDETAAWERAGIPDIKFDLLGEEVSMNDAARELGRLKLDGERKGAKDAEALAIERGDVGKPTPSNTIKLTIREKEVQPPSESETTADQSTQAEEDDSHLLLEGHKIVFGSKDSTADSQ